MELQDTRVEHDLPSVVETAEPRILEHFPEEPIAGMLKSLVDHTEESEV